MWRPAVALAGIIVRNAILLVDFIPHEREKETPLVIPAIYIDFRDDDSDMPQTYSKDR